MSGEEKKDNSNNNDNNENNQNEDNDEFLDVGNLNINQEVDIKENPKKHIVNIKKLNLLKSTIFLIQKVQRTFQITYQKEI